MAQRVPDRLPTDARLLHRHVCDLGIGRPRRQRQKARRPSWEARQLRSNLAAGHDPPAGQDLLPMHVQSRAPSMQRLHRALSYDKAVGATIQKTGTFSYGLHAQRPKPPRLGDNPSMLGPSNQTLPKHLLFEAIDVASNLAKFGATWHNASENRIFEPYFGDSVGFCCALRMITASSAARIGRERPSPGGKGFYVAKPRLRKRALGEGGRPRKAS